MKGLSGFSIHFEGFSFFFVFFCPFSLFCRRSVVVVLWMGIIGLFSGS